MENLEGLLGIFSAILLVKKCPVLDCVLMMYKNNDIRKATLRSTVVGKLSGTFVVAAVGAPAACGLSFVVVAVDVAVVVCRSAAALFPQAPHL